ncbi:transposase [Streptomyces sp. NPDC056738]|uniref:transposase n=1 Tax=Streptomyces sp. NPDC056738 TaxID=3345933 RepID=UPI0036AF7C04
MGRGELTDEQWGALETLLPKGARAGRPPVRPRRGLIDGVRFRVRTGVPWRNAPVEYGPWSRVYDLFRRWLRNGTCGREREDGSLVHGDARDDRVGRSRLRAPAPGPAGTIQVKPVRSLVRRGMPCLADRTSGLGGSG